MGSNKTPDLVSLVLATPVITAAMQWPAWLVNLIFYIPRQEIRELVARESA
ncbi:MAG: hypothetical protein VYE46_09160 [Cyanobacteriota bacterium]|nr:hypothetical protein [Cyanobacteriota bacterium]